jgi:hypothetical protein
VRTTPPAASCVRSAPAASALRLLVSPGADGEASTGVVAAFHPAWQVQAARGGRCNGLLAAVSTEAIAPSDTAAPGYLQSSRLTRSDCPSLPIGTIPSTSTPAAVPALQVPRSFHWRSLAVALELPRGGSV